MQKFEIGQRVTNDRGAWVTLKIAQHPSNFYHVYYFEHYATDFHSDITSTDSTSNMSRAKVERQMLNWLKNR